MDMDTKQKIKNIRKLIRGRVKLLQEFDDLKIYTEKLEKVRKKYARKV